VAEAPAAVATAQPAADPAAVIAEVLSGAFDAEPPAGEAAPAAPPKRVLAAEPDAPKLHKVLAQAGVGSRRDLEQMITDGRVTVNGEPAHTGQRISWGDRIAVDGKPVRVRIAPPPPRVLAYHKPAGRGRHARRPAAAAHRVPPPAAPAARQVAVGRPAGHQHRRACCCSPTRANSPTS
jgi:23S rRNA pseudouridine2605 synthase